VSNISWLVLYVGHNETKARNDRYGSLTRSKRTLKYFRYLDGRDSYLLGKKGGSIPRFLVPVLKIERYKQSFCCAANASPDEGIV
jgi:hypothetical protein